MVTRFIPGWCKLCERKLCRVFLCFWLDAMSDWHWETGKWMSHVSIC